MRYVIDKNVPLPAKATTGRKSKYPFDLMEVGASFFVPGKVRMASTVGQASRRLGRRFVWNEETGGVRVWRAADPVTAAEEPLPVEPVESAAPLAVEPVGPVEPAPVAVKRSPIRRKPALVK